MKIDINAGNAGGLRQKLKAIADGLRDMRPLWQAVGMYVQRQTIKERFDKEQSPEGQKWKPLAPATLKQRSAKHKTGHARILQDTGELRRSITYEAEPNSVRVGTSLKYARTHQFGRGNIPARLFLGVNDEEKQHIISMLGAYIKKNVMGGG